MSASSHRAVHRNKHHHNNTVNERNLLAATLLNLLISAVEIAGGLLSGSLALLSDALHNLSDTFATFIAYLATLIGRRDANPKKTFGYKRIEILSALLNAVILLVISIYLVKEAFERISDPRPIDSMVMIIVALIGLLANLLALVLLKKDAHKSINVRAAYVHLVGDAFSSLLVVAGGILIQFRQVLWIDPVITVLISLYIIREAFVILKESVNILMQSTPDQLDLQKVKRRVEENPEVSNIHHLHAWMLTDQEIHLEAHVELTRDMNLSQVMQIQKELAKIIKDEFRINHLTLQFEYSSDHSAQLIHGDK